ncbi:MAG: hypothetical protein HeimC3_25990 [Candidatus Heimdallarchaeota archaeon LC_3]|nr:MAG: hypothetical protein HeimC3_25990 [Candidatus Heimdallarchaeota archaeon LC_3]
MSFQFEKIFSSIDQRIGIIEILIPKIKMREVILDFLLFGNIPNGLSIPKFNPTLLTIPHLNKDSENNILEMFGNADPNDLLLFGEKIVIDKMLIKKTEKIIYEVLSIIAKGFTKKYPECIEEQRL